MWIQIFDKIFVIFFISSFRWLQIAAYHMFGLSYANNLVLFYWREREKKNLDS